MWGGFAAEFQKQKEEIHLETCCITGNLVHVHIRAYLFFLITSILITLTLTD